MSEIVCRLLEKQPQRLDQRPGDMWFCEYYLKHSEEDIAFFLAPEYLKSNRKDRPPLMLVLPGGAHWLVDGNATGVKSGWIVTGVPPKITARPSISVEGSYHGYLTDGVLKGC